MILCLVHHHHDIVGRLVIHQQLTVAIVDTTTRRILYLLEESIGVGTLLIVVTGYLERKEADDIDHHNE